MPTLYVVHQCADRFPELPAWVDEAWAVVKDELPGGPWIIRKIEADLCNTFDARDVHSLVSAVIGPVVIAGALKDSAIAALRERLATSRVVIPCVAPTQSTDLLEAFTNCCSCHADGEPHLSQRLVTALLIVRKLERHKYWGGKALYKRFLYVSDLPNGGFPADLQPLVIEVANQLQLKGLLTKKRSRQGAKVALNPDMRKEVHDFIDNMAIQNEGLHKYLFGGDGTISARVLDKYLGDGPSAEESAVFSDEKDQDEKQN